METLVVGGLEEAVTVLKVAFVGQERTHYTHCSAKVGYSGISCVPLKWFCIFLY